MANDPFGQSLLASLFLVSDERPDVLKRRESTSLELKANFSRSSSAYEDYGRTMAAFANRGGGYLVFGVTNQPHRLVGMTNDRLTTLDPADMTEFLNVCFAPSIDWEMHIHEEGGKHFGILFVHEATVKPVVCARNGGSIRDGGIYYRYGGQTRLILSADLHKLIQQRVDAERRTWQELLARTAHVTPSATYLLDLQEGRALGASRSFVISPELMEKIRFIDEGRFTEGGDPTLRVIGDVEVVRTETVPESVEEVPVDPSKYCKLWEKDVVTQLRDRIGEEIPSGSGAKTPLNGTHIRAVIKAHQVPTPSKMYYRPAIVGSRPQYGQDLIDWVEEEFRKDEQFFRKAMSTAKSAQQGG